MRKTGAVVITFFLWWVQSFAGGFQVNLQGQKQIAMGHCGTALNLGASNAFFNPGLFSFTDSCEISVAGSFVFANVSYLAPHPSNYTANTLPSTGTPFTFFSNFRIKPESNWNFGVAVYTPFGSTVQYEDDWMGQFLIREMSLQTIFFQPTIACKVNEKLGVGVGYVYTVGNFALRRGVPIQNQQGEYGEANLTGDGTGQGFNIGVNYYPTDNISIGASYRSSVRIGLNNGAASFTVPESVQEFFPTTSFTSSLTLPDVINVGTALQLSEKSTLALDINYVGWRSYDTLSFDFADNTEKLEDIASPREYRNAAIVRGGFEYRQDEKLTLRSGAYYDFTPLQNPYITPETPDADKIGLSAGASYLITKNFNVNLSFLYVNGFERTATNEETGFGGTWRAQAIIPGVGLDFIF